MSARLLLSVVAAALASSACDAPTSYADSHELGVAAQHVASLAGEAEWLALQLRTGEVSEHFAWVHQQAIGDDAANLAGDLAKPVLPAVRPTQDNLAQLDARLLAQAGRIAPAAKRPDELAALQREFRKLAEQALSLRDSS